MQPNNDRTVNQPNGNQNHSNLTPAANRNPRTQISPNVPQSTNQQQQFQTLGQALPQQAQQQFHHMQQAPQQQQQFQHLPNHNQQTRASQIPQNQQQQFQVLPNNQQLPNYQQLAPGQLQPPQTAGLQQQASNVQNNQGPRVLSPAQLQQMQFQQQQQQPQMPVNFYPGNHHGMNYLPGGVGHSLPPHNLSSMYGYAHNPYASLYSPPPAFPAHSSPKTLDSKLAKWKDTEDLLIGSKNEGVKTEPANDTGMLIETQNVLLADALKLEAVLQSDSLPHSESTRILPVMVSLKEALLNDAQVDTKTDIICIIDVSGSMAGTKLDNVKSTMKLLLELLPGSRLAIVLFGTNAQVWMNFKTVNSDNTPKIIKVIDAIVDKDSTNITAGLHRAQDLLGNRKTKNQVSSMFLLSDGQHNQGPINNNILFDGDMGRTETEYSLHTFGYGDDHDAKLMQSMAERKGGNYYFVQDIKKVDECFLDCLGMVTTMLATNGKVNISLVPTALYPEIRIVNTYGAYLKKISDTQAVLEIPTIYAGMRKDYLFDVEFEKTKKQLTAAQLLEVLRVEFECYDIGSASAVKLAKSFSVNALPVGSQEMVLKNLDVTKNYLRVKTGDVLEKVEQLQALRKDAEALSLLKALGAQLDQELELLTDSLIISLKEQVAQIVKMVTNDSQGVHNEFKTANYVAQQRNVYMNQQSAPQFSQQMYANSRQSQNADIARFRKS